MEGNSDMPSASTSEAQRTGEIGEESEVRDTMANSIPPKAYV